jgi:hypothetical protein
MSSRAARSARPSWRAAATASLVAVALAAPVSKAAAQAQTLTMGAAPATIHINTAVAGQQPTAGPGTTTFSVKTNGTNRRITAHLTSAPPSGITITITATAPGGKGTSVGPVVLSTTPQDIVTGIPNTGNVSGTITYSVSTTVATGVVAATSRSVTLTLVSP